MIGYLALARDTFDINYALDNKKRFEKFIDILDIKYSHFKELITDDETGKKAIRYLKLNGVETKPIWNPLINQPKFSKFQKYEIPSIRS